MKNATDVVSPRRRWNLRTAAMQVIVCVIAVELACQAYFVVLSRRLSARRQSPDDYFEVSDDPNLAYQLARGKAISHADRSLKINHFGIRDDSDNLFPRHRRLALLGDSVTFGVELSQEESITAVIQRQLDPKVEQLKVLNFGVPGYGLTEMPEWLKTASSTYYPTEVIFLLNLNDFCRRESIYEGADNGLYRTYRRPLFMLPFFVSRAIHRYHKWGHITSVEWYKWLYDGNRDWGFRQMKVMKDFAHDQGFRLSVAIYPAGVAYTPAGYALESEEVEISNYLRGIQIPVIRLEGALSPDCFDGSDHLTKHGAEVAAGPIAQQFSSGAR